MIKKVITAVCAALVLAVQTAFPAFAEDSDYRSLVEEIFIQTSAGGDFWDGMEYGGADRIAYCYTELYGADGAEDYIVTAKAAAEELMASERFVKPTDLQKCAIALSHYGECSQQLIDAAVYLNEDFSKQGLNAYIWGLIAVDRAEFPAPEGAQNTRASMTEYILSKQLSDGGFVLTGSAADCDITSAVIYALAPQRDDSKVAEAIGRAFEALRQLQGDRGFASMGEVNCESTAQAIIAAASLGETVWLEDSGVLEDLLLYRTVDGFSHLEGGKANPLATSQACSAITAYLKLAPQEAPAIETEQTQESLQAASQEVNSQQEKLTGGTIKLVAVVLCSVVGIVFALAWLLGGRKRLLLLVLTIVFAVVALLAAFTDFSTAEEHFASHSGAGALTVTVYAECQAVFDAADKAEKGVVLPASSTVITECTVSLSEEETALDALAEAAREQQVTIDYIESWSGAYIRGIAGLYEFDFGSESGWLYYVNGESPSCAVSEYILQDGDVLTLNYTCALGRAE